VLQKFQIRPDKRLGQVFLVDTNSLIRVAEAAEIQADSVVLEIGAGVGNLTRQLATRAARVLTVEIDDRLIPALRDVLSGTPNVTIIEGDILKVNVQEQIGQDGYLVVANIPYYITSAIMRSLLKGDKKPKRIVLTIQKEVAQRICAAPGDMSLLALSVQVFGTPRLVRTIPAGAFYPVPDVDSAILRVDIFDEPLIPAARLDRFFSFAKSAFSQKRKNLRNSLSGGLGWKPARVETLLGQAGIDFHRRAETLSLEEWRRIIDEDEKTQAESEFEKEGKAV
jgi:16S rRNA (adenine1518-N6/adenine1519-N6)-dimethyltransferase